MQPGKVWAEKRINLCKYAQQHLQTSCKEPSLETYFYKISFVNDNRTSAFLLLVCPKPHVRELAQVINISVTITFYWLLVVGF